MGERNYIELKDDGIYLYSHHNTKEDMRKVVKEALKRGKDRWGDRQYLNRIIFSELIKDDVLGLTDYGLSKDIWDGQVAVVVEVDAGKVDGISFEDFVRGD